MLGIILTLFAVLFVIFFAFCYTDHPAGRGPRAEALYYVASKSLKKNPDRADQ